MDYSKENQNWDSLSYVEKNHQLYLKQKALLDQFLEKGAISQAQHDIPFCLWVTESQLKMTIKTAGLSCVQKRIANRARTGGLSNRWKAS